MINQKHKNLLKKNIVTINQYNTYDLTKILNKKKKSKHVAIIQELQSEIKTLKKSKHVATIPKLQSKIKTFKTKLQNLKRTQ